MAGWAFAGGRRPALLRWPGLSKPFLSPANPTRAGVSAETTGTLQMPYAVRVGLLRYYADQAGESRGSSTPMLGTRALGCSSSAAPAHSRLLPLALHSEPPRAGKNYEYRLIRRVVRHPAYSSRTTAFDVALL